MDTKTTLRSTYLAAKAAALAAESFWQDIESGDAGDAAAEAEMEAAYAALESAGRALESEDGEPA